MKYIVQQTESAGKMFWIAHGLPPSWFYHGPFADEAEARAFVRANFRDIWKDSYRWTRMMRRHAAALNRPRLPMRREASF